MRRDLVTAYHEAGHAVVAWDQHITVKAITIVPEVGAHGSVRYSDPLKGIALDCDRSTRARLRGERLIRVALAGAIAQRQFDRHSWKSHHSSQDHEKAADIAEHISTTEEELSALLNLLEIQTRQIVDLHWNLVDRLAQKLLKRKKMNGREVREFCRSAV